MVKLLQEMLVSEVEILAYIYRAGVTGQFNSLRSVCCQRGQQFAYSTAFHSVWGLILHAENAKPQA